MTGRVVDRIADGLAAAGVRHVFGVGGANIEDLYDALVGRDAITGVVARHEFSAAAMADGVARTTGRLAAVAVTSGAGAMNLVPGLAEAHASRVPMIALVGQPPTRLQGRGAFQDTSGRAGSIDLERLLGTVTRCCVAVDRPEDVDAALARALAAATGDVGGPAALLLPKDVQAAPAAEVLPDLPGLAEPRAERPGEAGDPDRALGVLADAVAGTDPIVVVCGNGTARAGARTAVARLVARLGATVAVAADACDAVDHADPAFLGVTGAIGHPNVRDRIADAGLVVLVGNRFEQMVGGGLDAAVADARIVAIDPQPPHLEDRPDRPVAWMGGGLVGALRRATARLDDPALPPRAPGWSPGPVLRPAPPDPDGPALGVRQVVELLADAIPPGATIVSDAGNASATVIHAVRVPAGGRFVVAQGMGGMGHSLGAGIGAALATGRRSYVVVGDGGFLMHGGELHTAVELGAPVTFVVLDNAAHGMCVTRERLYFGGEYSFNRFGASFLGRGAAAAFPGLDAEHAGTADAVAAHLRRAAASSGPTLVSVPVDPDEIPPFAPFLDGALTSTTTQGRA